MNSSAIRVLLPTASLPADSVTQPLATASVLMDTTEKDVGHPNVYPIVVYTPTLPVLFTPKLQVPSMEVPNSVSGFSKCLRRMQVLAVVCLSLECG